MVPILPSLPWVSHTGARPTRGPGLAVDGPVDDVEQSVGPWEYDPGVLVYGVGVNPHVDVSSGAPHLTRDLRVPQRHLGQHPLLAAAVLRNPIIPCGDLHGGVACDLGVCHHIVRVANAAGTRQLQKGRKCVFLYSMCIC